MSNASVAPIPKWQVFDDSGLPMSGAKLYVYKVGTDTPADTYTNYLATTVAAWPIVFDAAGRSEVWLGSSLYKLVLKDANDTQIWSVDGVGGAGAGGTGSAIVVDAVDDAEGPDSSLVELEPAAASLVAACGYWVKGDFGGGSFYWDGNNTSDDGGVYIRPNSVGVGDPGRWVRLTEDKINVRWYGAKGNGAADDGAVIKKAAVYAINNDKTLLFPSGIYALTTLPWHNDWNDIPPCKLMPDSQLQPSGIFWINPLIDQEDTSQHFRVGYKIIFPAGTVIRPEIYGANSVSNYNADAVNACMSSLDTSGGTLFIHPNTSFTVENPINTKSYVNIEGGGTLKVVTKVIPILGHTAPMTNNIETNNIHIRDITIEGNYISEYIGDEVTGIGGMFNHVTIDNVKLKNCYEGISLGGAGDTTQGYVNIGNCEINGSQVYGIRVNQSRHLQIHDCVIDYTGSPSVSSAGIYISNELSSYDTSGIQISDNILHNCNINIIGTTIKDIQISDNNIDMRSNDLFSPPACINVEGAEAINVQGNICYPAPEGSGISISFLE